MVPLEVIKKIRNGIVNNRIIIFSDDDFDRINLVEVLSDYIVQEEEKCKKSKLTFD